ncbi:DUF2188 domain-containing protein [Mesorhizobium huakuii]|uniref:DUF2188 domain-containing protein n=1 Tax=Mesorhizobium huakuii TaxID=28104 RepID=A0A7G6SS93_9HYPH|nr:DUF2188 domain-containing protein [Mesorhizobium huakuii]QND57375.1 DUF2188 domain-containing protein [Mesorhizobium huakuii]
MANAKYYVSKEADRWKVRYEDKDYAYNSRESALSAAVEAANGAASKGHAAEVLVQGVDGKWRTEWPAG